MNTTKSSDANSSADGERLVCVVQHPVAQQSYEAIDLEQLVSVIWRRRWRIFIATAAITMAAVGYALLATPYYRAEAVLMARDPKTGFGVSSQLSQFAGLAGLAGINVGSASTQEPLGVLRSKGFARRFIEQNQLLGVLEEESTPLSGKGIGGEIARLDVRDAAERFMDSVLEVIDDKRSGLVVGIGDGFTCVSSDLPKVRLADGSDVTALSYVADRNHPQCAGKLSADEVVAKIRDAVGLAGPNIEYLRNTVQHLDDMGIGDCALHRILRMIDVPKAAT